MIRVVVTDREGRERTLQGSPGFSLMEILREAGVDEIAALCGGCRACGTCHVYVDPAFHHLLPPQAEEEAELLDGSLHRTEDSRLSCQIPCAPALDGVRLQIPPED